MILGKVFHEYVDSLKRIFAIKHYIDDQDA